MREKLRKILFVILYYLGVVRYFYHLNRNKQRVLVFHHIIPDRYINNSFEQKIVCTSEKKFRWLLEIVNKRLDVTLSLGKPGSVLITFDDGYRAALNAAKILREFGNKAIIFIPINSVDGSPLWIDKIMAWFAYVPDGHYQILGKNISLNTQAQRLTEYSAFVDTIYFPGNYNPIKIIAELNAIFPFSSLFSDEIYSSYRFRGLTKEEVESLKEEGFLFGGHSVQHDILSCLSDEEIMEDFEKCEKEIGKLYNCSLYAYPFGHRRDVSPKVVEAMHESAFTCAMMNEMVMCESAEQMSRINISHYDNKYEVEACLSGLTQALKKVLQWII